MEGFLRIQQMENFRILKSETALISHVPLCLPHLSRQHRYSPVENKISYSLTALKHYKAMNHLLILLSHLLSLELDADLLEGRGCNLRI